MGDTIAPYRKKAPTRSHNTGRKAPTSDAHVETKGRKNEWMHPCGANSWPRTLAQPPSAPRDGTVVRIWPPPSQCRSHRDRNGQRLVYSKMVQGTQIAAVHGRADGKKNECMCLPIFNGASQHASDQKMNQRVSESMNERDSGSGFAPVRLVATRLWRKV